MSLIDAAVRNQLLNVNAVTAIVADRIFFDMIPIGETLPAIIISLISDIPDRNVPGLWLSRVQISCWSNPVMQNGLKSPEEVSVLADAVKTALHQPHLNKGVSAWTVGKTTYSVSSVKVENGPRLVDMLSDWYHMPVDVLINFREV